MNKTDLRRQYRATRKAFVVALPKGEREALERNLAEVVAPALTLVHMAGGSGIFWKPGFSSLHSAW